MSLLTFVYEKKWFSPNIKPCTSAASCRVDYPMLSRRKYLQKLENFFYGNHESHAFIGYACTVNLK